MSTQQRPLRTAEGTFGSSTTSITSTNASSPSSSAPPTRNARLVLRAEQRQAAQEGESAKSEKRIHWAEDVVNNEGMGKKSSKVCCIYHKPRAVGESSDESSSDSSSDSESDSGDEGAARPTRNHQRNHKHNHNDEEGHECHNHAGHENVKGKAKSTPKNAYEKIPKP